MKNDREKQVKCTRGSRCDMEERRESRIGGEGEGKRGRKGQEMKQLVV